MNISKKLFTAVLFTCIGTLSVQAGPYDGLTWDEFAEKVDYKGHEESFSKAMDTADSLGSQQQLNLLGEVRIIQRKVISFCATRYNKFHDPSYHRALLERVTLANRRMFCSRKFTPNLLDAAVLSYRREVKFLHPAIGDVLAASSEESVLRIRLFADFLKLDKILKLNDQDTPGEEPEADDDETSGEEGVFEDAPLYVAPTPTLSPDSEVAQLIGEDNEDEDLNSQVGPDHGHGRWYSPFANPPSDEDGEDFVPDSEVVRHDILVATGTLALASAGYAAARRLKVRPRNAGAIAAVIGLAGAAYSVYEHGLWKPKRD